MESDMLEIDKETTLLSRVAVNHLFLSQFEAFRAIILTLRHRNPDLALSILQSIVANGGNFQNVVYSSNCSSPALLTWLSSLELFQFDEGTSIWEVSVTPEDIRLRVEFLLYVQMVSSRVAEGVVMEERDSGEEEIVRDLKGSMRVLDGIMELGLRRLKEDLIVKNERDSEGGVGIFVKEEELVGLTRVFLENADVFDSLCANVQRQVGGDLEPVDDSGLAITLRREERVGAVTSEEDQRLLKSIQKHVQVVHLDEMKQCLNKDDIDGVVSHIRHLNLDYGIAETEYRVVFQDLLKKVLSGKVGLGDVWHATRVKLLKIYREAMSSNCVHLVEIVQSVQDQLLEEKIKMLRASDDQVLPPFQHLQDYMLKLKLSHSHDDHSSSLRFAVNSCMRDLYHYARVAGLHVLECVMDTALTAVRVEQLEEVRYVISLFPRLQPLVAVMGWDLLPGKTAARRTLMKLLWTSKSQVSRLEESSLYEKESDERSCVEHLCESLCYRLDLASFVACVNSGQPWDIRFSLFFSGQGHLDFQDGNAFMDPFVENFVLERLSSQSPIRVLFDVVPSIKYEDAIKFISMQPINSTSAVWDRVQDVELVHMRYALDCAVLALGAMEKSVTDDKKCHPQMALSYLKQMGLHLEAINNVPRKIFMVNIIISLLHVDNIAVDSEQFGLAMSKSFLSQTGLENYDDTNLEESGNQMFAAFVESLLETLHHNLPSEHSLDVTDASGERQALEWRISSARSFIEDWQWRLSVLQQLLPLPELNWRWKEALTILRAAPSKLLNLCMQKSKYDIGEEAVHRFSLSYEDRATLALAEWVDDTFKRASVEDAVNRATDGTMTLQEIDFPLLRSQIGSLAAILLCIDVAAASARSINISEWLLNQAEKMLSEIYPGGSPKIGSTYWDQIREVALASVARRLLKRLKDVLEQERPSTLQAVLSGEMILASLRQGQRDRALVMLHQMVEDAHMGKRQFLSGKLHNLARAVADEETGAEFSDIEEMEQNFATDFDKNSFLGLGLKTSKRASLNLATGESNVQPTAYDVKDTEKRLFSPLSAKPSTYLSQFILHIAAIGDIVDGTDTTHDFNYFSVIYEWPKDLVTRLVFERGSTEAAEKVAEIMSSDFVHEVISACVPPVYPSRSGHGFASIPLVASNSKSIHGSSLLTSSLRGTWPSHYNSSSLRGIAQYPLQLEIIKHLVKISPVRAVLACVFGSSILCTGNESSVFGCLNKELLHSPDADRLFYEFALDQSERFPTLNRWIQFQMNLHRVSEVGMMSKNTECGDEMIISRKCSTKRRREHDTDTDSEVDDTLGSNPGAVLPDVQTATGYDTPQDSMQYPSAEDDATTVLTFDWENEEPYERAVER